MIFKKKVEEGWLSQEGIPCKHELHKALLLHISELSIHTYIYLTSDGSNTGQVTTFKVCHTRGLA